MYRKQSLSCRKPTELCRPSARRSGLQDDPRLFFFSKSFRSVPVCAILFYPCFVQKAKISRVAAPVFLIISKIDPVFGPTSPHRTVFWTSHPTYTVPERRLTPRLSSGGGESGTLVPRLARMHPVRSCVQPSHFPFVVKSVVYILHISSHHIRSENGLGSKGVPPCLN